VQWWEWLLISLGVIVAVYAAFLAWLVTRGRKEDARAFATFIPDCIVLVTRLARDPRVPRRRKLVLFGLVGYLALPFDLVPDFIPGSSTTRSSSRSFSAISSGRAANRWCASSGRARNSLLL